MLVRHGSSSQILQFAVRHPRELLYFPFRVYSGLGPGALVHLLRSSSAVPEVFGFRGHVANHLPYPPLASDCRIPEANIREEDRTASVRDLIRKYRRHRQGPCYIWLRCPDAATWTSSEVDPR